MIDRIVRMEITLFGPSGDNGVVGNQKKLLQDVSELRQTVSTVRTVLTALKWGLLVLNVCFALIAPDKMAEIIKAISGLIK